MLVLNKIINLSILIAVITKLITVSSVHVNKMNKLNQSSIKLTRDLQSVK
jgi:hypothetical protein